MVTFPRPHSHTPCISHLGSSIPGSAESPTASPGDLVGSPRIQQICRNKAICKKSVSYAGSLDDVLFSMEAAEQRSGSPERGPRCSLASRRNRRPQGVGASNLLDTSAPDLGGLFCNSLSTWMALMASAARLVTTGMPQNPRTHPSLAYLFEPASPPPNPLEH